MARTIQILAASLLVGVLSTSTASGATTTFMGSVSATGDAWRSHTFAVAASGSVSATLTWSTPSARLSLALSRSNGDGTWTWVKGARGTQPLRISAEVTPGTWRLRVKALTGGSGYTVVASYPSSPPPPTGPYMTIMMGRAIEGIALDSSCERLSTQAKMLDEVAAELGAHGLRATAPVTLSQVHEDDNACDGGLLYASWAELHQLRDRYGWDVVPRGPTNDVITGLSGEALWNATCGVLPTFTAHGFPDAWALYAYPQNRWTSADEQVVKTCYAYGRQYAGLGVSNRIPVADPYWDQVVSVNGGRCNDVALACYNDPNVKNGRRYMLPSQLDRTVSVLPGRWTSLQFYRFVTGSYGSPSSRSSQPAWDCTAADPRSHWSHQPESYCWNDFVAFLGGLPRNVTDASPADVARATGRTP
jgi:hypothetical protein